jgi:hypothetical protein
MLFLNRKTTALPARRQDGYGFDVWVAMLPNCATQNHSYSRLISGCTGDCALGMISGLGVTAVIVDFQQHGASSA